MSLLRNTSTILLSLFITHATVSVAQANTAPVTQAAKQRVQFKSPYQPEAAPLGQGPLLDLGGNKHVNSTQYSHLSLAVQTLLKKFPADKHYFVGLGRDPAPIIAFLQNLGGKELAVNFPASSNNAETVKTASLPTYVNKLIPEAVLKGDRSIVFVDVTSSGRALNFYVPHLTPLLNGRPVLRAAFAATAWTNITQSPGENHIIDTTPFPDVAEYPWGIYENIIAEYPRHVPGVNAISQLDKPLPGYSQYRGAVMQRMQRDVGLHNFLMKEAGPAFVHESTAEEAARLAEEKAAVAKQAEAERAAAAKQAEVERAAAAKQAEAERAAQAARVAQERSARAKDLVEARQFPTVMRTTIAELVRSLPPRSEGHDKGPYLSDSAAHMNEWLTQSVAAQAKVAELVPAVRRAGVNLVAGTFMDKVEQARQEGKIRNRDYRRLMGHALSYATLDEAMLRSLVARFEQSKHFRREITEEAEYFLTSHTDKPREETAHMAANFQELLKHLPAAKN